jgi:hypothetical protein
MRRVAVLLFVLAVGMMGCGGGDAGEDRAPAWQAEFPHAPYNAVTGESPAYQATQVLTPLAPQQVTSRRYAMTVSIF